MKKITHFILLLLFIIFTAVSYAQQNSVSQRFKQITKGEFKHIHLHWFPDSRRLITSLNLHQSLIGMGIIQTGSGKMNRVQIGKDFSGDFYTSISPDGKWILFDARKGRIGINIWRVNIRGGNPEQITQNGGQMPSWSPDGKQFVYVHNSDIYIKDLKTGEKRKIIDTGGADIHPCWSPDGKTIVFNPAINGNQEICIVSISGENLMNISNSPAQDVYPCWSPDSSKIVFHSDRSGTEDLWIYDIKSKSLEQLTSGKDRDVCPTWSPDGSKIAFSSDRNGNLEVWIMAVKPEGNAKQQAM